MLHAVSAPKSYANSSPFFRVATCCQTHSDSQVYSDRFPPSPLWNRWFAMFLSLVSPCICWDRFPSPFCEIACQLVYWTVGLPCCYCSTHLQSTLFKIDVSCRLSTQILRKQQLFFRVATCCVKPIPKSMQAGCKIVLRGIARPLSCFELMMLPVF